MKNKKTRRFKIRYIVFGLLGVMALAALVFMRFGGFGTGENVNPEEFLAYAEPVENITRMRTGRRTRSWSTSGPGSPPKRPRAT